MTQKCLAVKVEGDLASIPTGSMKLDAALGHGVRLGTIAEFVGSSGSGKTQMCLSLMINTILPAPVGLIDGDVAFISTRRSFCPQRVHELVDHAVSVYNKKAEQASDTTKKLFTSNFRTREEALSRIHCCYVLNLVNFMCSIYGLRNFNRERGIRLVVVDSFATHLRELPHEERNRIAYELLFFLETFARTNRAAVVLTNDLTTEVMTKDDYTFLKPALGEVFHNRIPQRILLAKNEKEEIFANIQKNLSKGPSLVRFVITKNGIRDVR